MILSLPLGFDPCLILCFSIRLWSPLLQEPQVTYKLQASQKQKTSDSYWIGLQQ